MKIDIANTLYSIVMILLAFVSALVITKTISKYSGKEEKNDEENI